MLSCIKRRQKYLQEEMEDMYCTGVHTHVSMVLQLLLHKRNGLVGGEEETTFVLLYCPLVSITDITVKGFCVQ